MDRRRGITHYMLGEGVFGVFGLRMRFFAFSRIHIDEMRTLLELWYDESHYQAWKDKDAKSRQRRGEYKVLSSIAVIHRQRLCGRLSLPHSVKCIFRRPQDEDDWSKLELWGVLDNFFVTGERRWLCSNFCGV